MQKGVCSFADGQKHRRRNPQTYPTHTLMAVWPKPPPAVAIPLVKTSAVKHDIPIDGGHEQGRQNQQEAEVNGEG